MAESTEIYTYYFPDGRIEVREGALQPEQAAWIDGAYPPPVFPSAVNVRVGRGIAVATIIGALDLYEGDLERVVAEWGNDLTREDIELAVWFYGASEGNRREIDEHVRPRSGVG